VYVNSRFYLRSVWNDANTAVLTGNHTSTVQRSKNRLQLAPRAGTAPLAGMTGTTSLAGKALLAGTVPLAGGVRR